MLTEKQFLERIFNVLGIVSIAVIPFLFAGKIDIDMYISMVYTLSFTILTARSSYKVYFKNEGKDQEK